jgi:hypothetical protein
LSAPACLSAPASNTADFSKTKKEASGYAAYLNTVYKNRIVPGPAHSGGQLHLF